MKTKIALAIAALPFGFAAYIAFYPGVATAEPRMPKLVAAGEIKKSGSYKLDATHTTAGFDIVHMGLSQVHGRFTGFSGDLVDDATDVTKGHVTFTIQTSTIDTAVPPRDHHLSSPDFFDVEKYPTITFKSSKIEKKGNHYVAYGDLTIKDVTKQIEIPFKHYGPIQDPYGSTRVGVVVDPITIKRSDYHVAWNQKLGDGTPIVADDVTVRLSLEGTLNN
jgi:polyisoprenoid-binding protein YceI